MGKAPGHLLATRYRSQSTVLGSAPKSVSGSAQSYAWSHELSKEVFLQPAVAPFWHGAHTRRPPTSQESNHFVAKQPPAERLLTDQQRFVRPMYR
jgi:hypothetical protein